MSETPSHFVAVCPNCLISLKVRLAYSGSHVRCKHCEYKFRAFASDHPVTPSSEEYQAGPVTTPGSGADRIDVVCPNCSAALRVRKELAGQHARCNQCDHKFLVKKIEEVPARIADLHPASSLLDQPHDQPARSQSVTGEPPSTEQRPELVAELASIREENERLGARLETLQQEHAEVQSARDSLLVQLEQLRGDHERLRSEHEQDRQELQRLRDELASVHEALRDELNERTAHHAQAMDASQVRSDELAEQLRQRENDFATKLDELERLAALRQSDAAAAEDLRGTLGRREQELQQESAVLRGHIDELQQSIARAEQAHQAERSRLDEQLHQARQELESARSEIGAIQSRESELLALNEQHKADHLAAIEAQRAKLCDEFQAELEAERSRHAEQITELHTRNETNAQLVDRLKAEILTIARSRSVPDADLSAAREEIADLRAKLADTEITKRSMSSLLEGMGIRLH